MAEVYTERCGTDAQWSFDTETNILTISGTGAVTETIAKQTDFDDPEKVPWANDNYLQVKKLVVSEGITALNCPRGLLDGVTEYGEKKMQIELPDSLEVIGSKSLGIYADIVIPRNVKTIAPAALYQWMDDVSLKVADDNPYYCVVDGVLFSKDKKTLVYYPAKKKGKKYVVPKSVTSIAPLAFRSVGSLQSVVLPDNLELLGAGAFYGCGGLESVNLSDSMRITSITDYDTSAMGGDWDVILDGDGTEFYQQLAKPFSGAFYATGSRAGTFEGTSLREITIPDSVKYISSNTFFNENYFQMETRLNKIQFGKNFSGAINIGDSQDGMETLTLYTIYPLEIDMPKENQTYCVEDGVLYSKDKTVLHLVADYKGKTFTVPKSVKVIANGAFSRNRTIETVIIPGDIESIGENAFAESEIITFTCKGKIEHMGIGAFTCSKVREVNIQEISKIADRAFMGSDVETVRLGKNVSEIGDGAFDACQILDEITLGENVTRIGRSAFSGCYELQSIDLGKQVQEIGSCAFYNCDQLSELVVGDKVKVVGESAFEHCDSLAEEAIPIPKHQFFSMFAYQIQKGVMRGMECLQEWRK